jgi:FPC/CPF motif-containing protein YcgG
MKPYTESRIREFILDDHPCVMAQSVIADESVCIHEYDSMKSEKCLTALFDDLKKYVDRKDADSKDFESLIAVFRKDKFITELNFEGAMWQLLQQLNIMDDHSWDPGTSDNPENKNFSFSLHGTSFYLVGMHPAASRFARKSPYTMIVFNLHDQFEKLREMNRYERVRDLIRSRDKRFQGSINPMLADFGTKSEARQYSGRKVEDSWKCPFHNQNS